MDILSEEQQNILNVVKTGTNVMVDAVAGTGKTTLILSIAKELSTTKILQMTYNSSLRIDVKTKVANLKMENIRVHTFHSLAVRYYQQNAFTDTELRRILIKNLPPREEIPKIDMLVLDECQDLTFLYFQFMVKFTKDMGNPIQLLVLGDYMQGLYDFKGADVRFLTIADDVWRGFPLLRTNQFHKCTMQMSFRITNQMCSFVNDVMLGERRMKACRDDQQVVYVRQSRNNIENIVSAEINRLFEKGVKPCEIFILGPSVKGPNSNIRKLENKLVERDIPCHVPMMENDKIDDRVIGGKVVFSTFHSVKGRQRKYVFVVGFDNSYHRFHARNTPIDECPKTIYVAATRATQGLYLLESDNKPDDRPFQFLQKSHIEMKQCDYIDFRGMHKTNFQETKISDGEKEKTKIYASPTDLIKFIPESVIEEISPILDKVFVTEMPEHDVIEIPSIIETKMGFFEEVSDLNGIAIPSMYYDDLFNSGTSQTTEQRGNILLELIKMNVANMKPNEHIYLKKIVETIPEVIETVDDYLYLANVHSAIQERLYFKLKQINRNEYNWLTEEQIKKCRERLENVIGADCHSQIPSIEEVIIEYQDDEMHKTTDEFLRPIFGSNKQFRFYGRVDLITKNIVWELKCTSKISIEHLLQVVIYAWLWRMRGGVDVVHSKNKQFKIFNIKTGEILRLDATMEELHAIMIALLKGKYLEEEPKTDEEFIEECRTHIEKCFLQQESC
jgi:hypothetical protein